ncbi:MAG TPA: hypothetical protein VF235_08220, partial [Actinomycetota bacterium]
RLWSEDGTLRFSTDRGDTLGSDAGLNDRELTQAAAADGSAVTVLSDRTITGDPAEPRQLVYLLAGDAAGSIAQVDLDDELLLGAFGDRWFSIQLVLLVGALVALTLAALSMREPIAPIGAKVPFYPTSVPENLSVVSREEATRMRHAGQHARDRIDSMQARVEELEAAKYTLEGDLQRALSALAARGGPSSAIARPSAPAPATAPAPAPAQASTVVPAPTPRRREPVVAAEAVTVVVPSKDVEAPAAAQAPTPAPSAPPAAVPTPEPVVPAPAAKKPRRPAKPAAAPVPSSPEPVARAVVSLPESEVVPSPRPVPVAAAADGRDAEVIDVLERLVEPAGAQTLHPELDPSEIRARLAKTAASKKPGSRQDRDRFTDGSEGGSR